MDYLFSMTRKLLLQAKHNWFYVIKCDCTYSRLCIDSRYCYSPGLLLTFQKSKSAYTRDRSATELPELAIPKITFPR